MSNSRPVVHRWSNEDDIADVERKTREHSGRWTWFYRSSRILWRFCLPVVIAALSYQYTTDHGGVDKAVLAFAIIVTVVYNLGINEDAEACTWNGSCIITCPPSWASWTNFINAFYTVCGLRKRVQWQLLTTNGGTSTHSASDRRSHRTFTAELPSVTHEVVYYAVEDGVAKERRESHVYTAQTLF